MPEPEQEQPQQQPKHQPAEYKFIAAWGRYVGSFQYYIEDLQRKAAEENAPLDSIYKSKLGTWILASGLSANQQETLKDYTR